MKKILNYIKLILFKIKHGYFYKKYLKEFSTYEKVEKYCSEINSNNYSDEKLNDFRLKRFLNNIDTIPEIKKYSFYCLEESINNYLLQFKSFPKILDIGGGFGDDFLFLRKKFNAENIEYSILETKKVVELSKNINFQNKSNQKLFFYNSVDEAFIKNDYDLIFISGTLQYLNNLDLYLNKINTSNVKFISLTRNTFGHEEKFNPQFTFLFDNGAGKVPGNFKNSIIVYPHKTIIEKKLINSLNNYKVKYSKTTIEPPGYKGTYSMDILLEKLSLK